MVVVPFSSNKGEVIVRAMQAIGFVLDWFASSMLAAGTDDLL
jgi:hypothetical protein